MLPKQVFSHLWTANLTFLSLLHFTNQAGV